jgi:hypothetical protein
MPSSEGIRGNSRGSFNGFLRGVDVEGEMNPYHFCLPRRSAGRTRTTRTITKHSVPAHGGLHCSNREIRKRCLKTVIRRGRPLLRPSLEKPACVTRARTTRNHPALTAHDHGKPARSAALRILSCLGRLVCARSGFSLALLPRND